MSSLRSHNTGPTYSAWREFCLNHGCIGGAYPDSRESCSDGRNSRTGAVGERPEDIPVVKDPDLQVEVDWRALQRWHIPESALPAGSVILYRPLVVGELPKYVIATIVVIAVAAAADYRTAVGASEKAEGGS